MRIQIDIYSLSYTYVHRCIHIILIQICTYIHTYIGIHLSHTYTAWCHDMQHIHTLACSSFPSRSLFFCLRETSWDSRSRIFLSAEGDLSLATKFPWTDRCFSPCSSSTLHSKGLLETSDGSYDSKMVCEIK